VKKLVVVLVVVVFIFALSAPAFAFADTVPGKHADTGRGFGGAVSSTVRGENPNMDLSGFIGHVGGRLPF